MRGTGGVTRMVDTTTGQVMGYCLSLCRGSRTIAVCIVDPTGRAINAADL